MSIFSQFLRFYHTLKPLRFEQYWFRLLRKLLPLKRLSQDYEGVGSSKWEWHALEFMLPTFQDNNKACFLNRTATIDNVSIWNDSNFEKLWLYNLHYFDDLNAINSLSRKNIQYALVKRWISENLPVKGNGWEPYTLSLRLVNWIKWYRRANIEDQEILRSISQQAEALSKQLEYHILGNHLFANAKALVFVGCFLDSKVSDKYLHLGLKILSREVNEQFLSDGGHFELSPMYHNILLWDLLDLINLARLTKGVIPSSTVNLWVTVAERAMYWLDVMMHPDGEISFFNDSAFGIAASPRELKQYAKNLGIQGTSSVKQTLITLDNSGYSRINQTGYSIIFDHAEVGPDYLPAHGHADSLSFECSIGAERLIVNSGTSIYGVSAERLRQRKTPAHSTVVVDNCDSSEVWSGFRVARRAGAKLNIKSCDGNDVHLSVEHDGYKRLSGKVIHSRSIFSSPMKFIINDSLVGSYNQAYAIYHLHPDVKVKVLSDFQVSLTLPSGICILVSSGGHIVVLASSWHPRFGTSIDSLCLKLEISFDEISVEFSLI